VDDKAIPAFAYNDDPDRFLRWRSPGKSTPAKVTAMSLKIGGHRDRPRAGPFLFADAQTRRLCRPPPPDVWQRK
ncbi:MAG: hypothetical protein ABWZ57_20635, partial [Mesorhizobium sp.]